MWDHPARVVIERCVLLRGKRESQATRFGLCMFRGYWLDRSVRYCCCLSKHLWFFQLLLPMEELLYMIPMPPAFEWRKHMWCGSTMPTWQADTEYWTRPFRWNRACRRLHDIGDNGHLTRFDFFVRKLMVTCFSQPHENIKEKSDYTSTSLPSNIYVYSCQIPALKKNKHMSYDFLLLPKTIHVENTTCVMVPTAHAQCLRLSRPGIRSGKLYVWQRWCSLCQLDIEPTGFDGKRALGRGDEKKRMGMDKASHVPCWWKNRYLTICHSFASTSVDSFNLSC